MNKLKRSYSKQRQSSRFFSVVSRILIAIPFGLIAIGDFCLWVFHLIETLSIRFALAIGNFIALALSRLHKSGHKLHRVIKKISRVVKFKRRGTVFNYYRHEKRVAKQRKKQSIYISLLTKLRYIIVGCIFSFFFIFLPLIAIVFIQDLPSPNNLSLSQPPQTTKIYDRNGVLLYQIYAQQNRTLVSLKDVPINLQHATIAIEDKDFYYHPGFDITAILRAAIADALGKPIQGGSTITQQLIKSTLLTSQQTLFRKLKEVILAFWAERLYSKNEILEMYFNEVPYGGTAWGIEAASEVYFNKHVQDLDLAQSAFLAGLTSAPSEYSPFGTSPDLWKSRQKEVLLRMVASKYITPSQAKQAEAEHLVFAQQQTPYYAQHFVNYVLNMLDNKYGEAMVEKGGLIVKTSLDLNIQNMAQSVVSNEVRNDAYLSLSNGAAVITNPQNGDILAMVGSHDFNDPNGGNVNLATSLRQPGSSIKVVTYSAAFQRGLTAASYIDDTPTTFTDRWGNTYSPVNYDGRFHGRVTVRTALANSFNIPAVKTLNQIGIPAMVDLGKEMGIQSWGDPSQYGLSITLGGADVTMLDMARVYGTLANSGTEVELNPILSITDYKGDVVEQKDTSTIQQTTVLDPGIAFILGNILSDNNARQLEFGPSSPLYIPNHYVPVKTGTTDDKRDNWTDGYTNKYVVITWVGNNNNTPMSQSLASGITGAAPIWHQIMSTLLQTSPEQKTVIPDDVLQKNCNGINEYFIRGTESSVQCGNYPTWTPTPLR